MNFTDINEKDSLHFSYVYQQVELGVSFSVRLQVDRATGVQIWEQVWWEIGMKIHEEIICGKRMLRK
jgi:hypothetical protein